MAKTRDYKYELDTPCLTIDIDILEKNIVIMQAAADAAGSGGHKEINRTTLSMADVENGLETAVVRDQLSLLKLRNNHKAFEGRLEITETDPDHLHLAWRNGSACAILEASLRNHDFTITHWNGPGTDGVMRFVR